MDTLHNIREEWIKRCDAAESYADAFYTTDAGANTLADWWLTKMESYGTAIREEIREKIKKIHFISEDGLYCPKCNEMLPTRLFDGFDISCRNVDCNGICIPTWAKYRDDILSTLTPKE